jgi:hypothetical protein
MQLEELEKRREAYLAKAEYKYQKQVAIIYREALDEIRLEMAKIYDKYAINGVLTKAQMTKYNRLAALEKKTFDALSPAVKDSIKVIDKLRPEEYGEAFFRTAWAVDNATGVGLDWGPLDKAAILENLDNPFYDAARTRLKVTLPPAIKTTINNGLALGQSYAQMMRDVKDLVNLKNFETMRILRTELHAAQEAGIVAGYEEAKAQGINGKEIWIATLDGNTRDSHQAMDGVAKDDDGFFRGSIGRARYPGDYELPASQRINCRCDTRFEIEGFEPAVRRDREGGVLPYQTYPEWVKDKKIFA